MKFVWTVAGDDPDFAACDRHGIDGYFAPMFDQLTTKAYLEKLRGGSTGSRGHAVGLYVDTSWAQFSGASPTEVAELVDAEYRRLFVPGLRVQWDMEDHDPELIARRLEEWRIVQRHAPTSWTMEGGQGGWMGPVVTPAVAPSSFVMRILGCRVRLVPQLYNGAMTQVWDSLTFTRDLTKRGFPDSIISPFYDAKHLPVGWDGYAFTAGRLPA